MGTDGLRLGGNFKAHWHAARACARSCPFWGRLCESLVSWHASSFGRLCSGCVTSIYSRVATFQPVDTSEGAQAALPCDSHGPSDFGRVIYLIYRDPRTGLIDLDDLGATLPLQLEVLGGV
jgi:hypothetical protein